MPTRVTTQTQLSSDGQTEVNVVDYLIMDVKTIVYRTHKTRASTGEVRQVIPAKVFNKIKASLVAYPREWLFIQLSSAGKPLKQQKPLGKGIGQIMKQKHVIGLGVNDARHDWITFYAHSKRDSKGTSSPVLDAATALLNATMLGSWSVLNVSFSPSYPDWSSISLTYLTTASLTPLARTPAAQKTPVDRRT